MVISVKYLANLAQTPDTLLPLTSPHSQISDWGKGDPHQVPRIAAKMSGRGAPAEPANTPPSL